MGYILINACINGHLELIKYLVNEKQCSLQINNQDIPYIIHATMNKHVECIVWMLNNGSSLADKFQDTRGNIVNLQTILQKKGLFEKVKRIMIKKSSRK